MWVPSMAQCPPGSTNPRGAWGPALWPRVRPSLTWKRSWAPGGAGKPRVCVFTVASAGLLWSRHRSFSTNVAGGGGELLPAGRKLHPDPPAWGWGAPQKGQCGHCCGRGATWGSSSSHSPFGVPPPPPALYLALQGAWGTRACSRWVCWCEHGDHPWRGCVL